MIADAEGRKTFGPPEIRDFGADFTQKLLRRLPQAASWWPPMVVQSGVVPANYVHGGGDWLRIEVTQFEIAPPPLRTIYAGVHVSLRRPGGQEVWAARKIFSGVVHGGEKITEEKLVAGTSQLQRELDRASDWLVTEVAAQVR